MDSDITIDRISPAFLAIKLELRKHFNSSGFVYGNYGNIAISLFTEVLEELGFELVRVGDTEYDFFNFERNLLYQLTVENHYKYYRVEVRKI